MAEEHVKIREQLSTFVAQYEKSEKEHAEHAGYVQKLIKTKGLEVQLAEARLAKQEQLTEAANQHALIYQEDFHCRDESCFGCSFYRRVERA